MIEQRINRELNKEQTEIKVSSLTLYDNIISLMKVLTLLAMFICLFKAKAEKDMSLHSCLIGDNSIQFLIAIPSYKLLLAAVTTVIANMSKRKCFVTRQIRALNKVVIFDIFTITLLVSALHQLISLFYNFHSTAAYSYYILVVAALTALPLLRVDIILKIVYSMAVVASTDFLAYEIIGTIFCNVHTTIKRDMGVYLHSVLTAVIIILLSCYAVKVINKFFTAYRLRETKLRQYKTISETDMLMQISNRRALDTDLSLLSESDLTTVAVAMFDIDDFKNFNDKYGHLTGDYVLTQVGKLISSFSEHNGVEAYRYGGEELMILFSNVEPIDDIKEQIELFRSAVSNIEIPDVPMSITISAGLAYGNVSTVEAGERRMEALLQLIAKADKNLYEAKRTGKNKLCTSYAEQ